MDKIEEIKELFKAVHVVQTTDVKELYADLVKCMEDWMQGVEVTGKVECVLYENNKLGTTVMAIFDFGKKQFSITTGEYSDEYFCLGLFRKGLQPRWCIYYIKVLLFYAKIDKILDALRNAECKFEENLAGLINLTILLQEEHLPKLQAIEKELTADAVERKLVAEEEIL